ncbi:MAG: tetratricopeptide repeat protein, partial [Candidatus Omnitrophica bacterium]|nr:tetratricopeptide repeat protein [Candidatus Omnitrophota bacterium]
IQRAFLREDFKQVTELAQAFILQSPEVPEAPRVWLWLVLSLDKLQQSGDALRELDRLKARLPARDPLWPEALFWEGDISRRAFQMLRAKLAYQQLLDRSPDSTWADQAKFGLGLVYLHQQAFEPALGYFHELSAQHEGDGMARDAMLFEGLCRLRLKQCAKATDLFNRLLPQLQDPGSVAQVSFYLGESLSGAGHYEEAAVAYQRVAASSTGLPWYQPAQFGLGWAYYRLDRCDESLKTFEQYLARTGDHRTEALFAQGSCLMRLGREDEALTRFEEIVSRDPDHPLGVESALVIADAYQRQARFTLAKELLHTFLRRRLSPVAQAQIQLRLGAIALGQGNAAQAKTIFALAAQREEPSIRQAALNGLGDVQLFLGNLPAAKPFYEQAVAAEPEGALAHYAVYQTGRIALQTGALDEAIEIFQRLQGGDDPALAEDATLALVIAYLNRHEEDLARATLNGIRQQQPTSSVAARAAYYQALLALGEGDEPTARTLCGEAVAGSPNSDEAFEARLLLADLQARRGSSRDAMAELQRVYDSGALSLSHRAQLAKRLGDFARSAQAYREAIRWYEEAASLLPSLSGEAGYHAASCYEEAGDLETAIRWYQAVEQPPWRIRGQLAAAKLLERQDRLDEAGGIYERLAHEPIPEAKLIRERLATLRGARHN